MQRFIAGMAKQKAPISRPSSRNSREEYLQLDTRRTKECPCAAFGENSRNKELPLG